MARAAKEPKALSAVGNEANAMMVVSAMVKAAKEAEDEAIETHAVVVRAAKPVKTRAMEVEMTMVRAARRTRS